MLTGLRKINLRVYGAGMLLLLLFCASLKVILSIHDASSVIDASYTDHMSHDQATVLFFYRGLQVYEPILQTCNHADDFVGRSRPAPDTLRDRCYLRERSTKPPLLVNWSQLPRAYPPGIFLYSALEAALFEGGFIGIAVENRFTVVKYLGACCALLWILGELFFARGSRQKSKVGSTMRARPAGQWLAAAPLFWLMETLRRCKRHIAQSPWPIFGIFLWPILAAEAMRWTLVGFYDPLAITFGVAAFIAAGHRQWVRSTLWLSFAIFLHYRMLWYCPLFAWNTWHYFVDRGTRPWTLVRREKIELILSAILVACSCVGFVLLWPQLRSYPAENPLRHGDIFSLYHLTFWLPVGCLVAFHLWNSDWLQAISSSWLVMMLFQTQQYRPWHALSLIPTLAVAFAQGGRLRHLASATLLIIVATLYGFLYVPSSDWLTSYAALLLSR